LADESERATTWNGCLCLAGHPVSAVRCPARAVPDCELCPRPRTGRRDGLRALDQAVPATALPAAGPLLVHKYLARIRRPPPAPFCPGRPFQRPHADAQRGLSPSDYSCRALGGATARRSSPEPALLKRLLPPNLLRPTRHHEAHDLADSSRSPGCISPDWSGPTRHPATAAFGESMNPARAHLKKHARHHRPARKSSGVMQARTLCRAIAAVQESS